MTVAETRPTTLMELLDHAAASESTGLRVFACSVPKHS